MSNNIVQRLTELSQSMMEGYPLNDGDFTDIDEAIMLIERLIVERDEARRDACEFAAIVAGADNTEGMESGRFHEIAMKYMRDRGWDCYREDQ